MGEKIQARVMIVDADTAHAAELKAALQSIDCFLFVTSDQNAALRVLGVQRLDLVVVVSSSRAHWRKDAERFADAVRHLVPDEQPQIVCVLQGSYQGPGERLYGDRLKIKVLYER